MWRKMMWWMMERYFSVWGKFDCADIDPHSERKKLR